MIEKSSDEMEISSTSLDLLSQAASLLNRTQHPPVTEYGNGVSSCSPPKDLPTKGQKVRRKKSVRREVISGSSAIKIRAKKAQISTGGDLDMYVDGFDTTNHVSSSMDQSVPPPPYPSSPSPPRNPVLPPYPSSYRGDPLVFPKSTVTGLNKSLSNNNNTPLDMSKKSLQSDSVAKQHRPSVITCVSALQQQQQCRHDDEKQNCPNSGEAEKDELQQGHRREVLSGMCDPVIDEHFRRSLGKDYSEIFSSNATPSVSVTVDDHFAKALGDTWLRLQQPKPATDATKPKTTARQPVVHAQGLVTL